MSKNRLEAFSDGVFAIIITIMVLEFKSPPQASFAALCKMTPALLSYILSYIFVGIYWNNHHHLLHATRRVNGAILWANLHLLFWLTLVPFVTGWMGQSHFATAAVATYGIVLFMAAMAFTILVRLLIAEHGRESTVAHAVGADRKGWLSLLLYAIAIPVAWIHPWLACGIFIIVAIIWLVPDRRIEKVLREGAISH